MKLVLLFRCPTVVCWLTGLLNSAISGLAPSISATPPANRSLRCVYKLCNILTTEQSSFSVVNINATAAIRAFSLKTRALYRIDDRVKWKKE